MDRSLCCRSFVVIIETVGFSIDLFLRKGNISNRDALISELRDQLQNMEETVEEVQSASALHGTSSPEVGQKKTAVRSCLMGVDYYRTSYELYSVGRSRGA